MTAKPNDAARWDRSLLRVRWITQVLGIAGTIFVSIYYGWQTGLGFLVAALASYWSLWRWHRVVDSLGPDSVRVKIPVRRFILQFGLLAATGYVIVKYLEVNRLAAVSGLLVAAAAVLLEILYELIYGS
jgi:hypothetical protein